MPDAGRGERLRELRALGVDVRRITVIPDEVQLIAEVVADFSRDFDVVFTSGGVGPTHDDVTIEGVARAMTVPVVRHPALVELLERYYRGTVTDAALRMAELERAKSGRTSEPRPWQRLGARLFDYAIWGLVLALLLTLALAANNIFDVEARRHSSLLKDYAPLAGRDVRLTARFDF